MSAGDEGAAVPVALTNVFPDTPAFDGIIYKPIYNET